MTEKHTAEELSFVPLTEVHGKNNKRPRGYWTNLVSKLVMRPGEAVKIPITGINTSAFRSNISVTGKRLGVKVGCTFDDQYAYLWVKEESRHEK